MNVRQCVGARNSGKHEIIVRLMELLTVTMVKTNIDFNNVFLPRLNGILPRVGEIERFAKMFKENLIEILNVR